MSFIERLELREDTIRLREVAARLKYVDPLTLRSRQFKPLEYDWGYLSIQASALHRCTPWETLEDLSQYKTMEMAAMSVEGGFLDVGWLDGFDRGPELVECFDGTVYNYVPVELIAELVEWLDGR
jgi:hypothetical protein